MKSTDVDYILYKEMKKLYIGGSFETMVEKKIGVDGLLSENYDRIIRLVEKINELKKKLSEEKNKNNSDQLQQKITDYLAYFTTIIQHIITFNSRLDKITVAALEDTIDMSKITTNKEYNLEGSEFDEKYNAFLTKEVARKEKAVRVEADRIANEAARVEADRIANEAARIEAEKIANEKAKAASAVSTSSIDTDETISTP